MKVDVSIPMDSQIHSIVFLNHKFKEKRELLIILFEVCRYILTQYSTKDKITPHKNGYIHLLKGSVSRLYFVDTEHCYSIGFPFTITQDGRGNIVAFSADEITLLPIIFVGVLQILKSDEWHSTEIFDFANPIDEWQSKQLSCLENRSVNYKMFWTFFRNMMMYDVGYIRHDHAPNQYNSEHPKDHPVDHIHGGYESGVSYRIGLTATPTIEDIKDITNSDTDCWMLSK